MSGSSHALELGPLVETFDGAAVVVVGDVLLAVYRSRSSVPRNRWVWQRVERAIGRYGAIVALLVVLPTASAPDAETRAHSAQMLTKNRAGLRRFVTVVEGDALWLSVVRTVTRATVLLSGMSAVTQIVDAEAAGLDAVRAAATAHTPPREALAKALRAAREALRER